MASLKRKPRHEFPYVLKAQEGAADAARFILRPPGEREWAVMLDSVGGPNERLFESVARYVVRVENDPEAAQWGDANSDIRRAYLDDVGYEVIFELGNAIADTLLTERDAKN